MITPETRLRDLTVGEFVAVMRECPAQKRFVTGLQNIAEYLGVSEATVGRWAASDELDGAITKVGKIIMLDTYKLK